MYILLILLQINMSNAKKTITYIDLFCGMGSFHYSFQKLGFQCIMACDIYKPAKINYKHNYKMDTLGDICDIDPSTVEPYDILCAGFPCQPFSRAGRHKGFKDSRGNMFLQVMRFININSPKIVVLENVSALLTHDKGKTFSKIKTHLHIEKYKIVYKVLKCSDYGIPQMRKRLFVIGFKNVEIKNVDEFFNLSEYEKNTSMKEYLGKNFKKKHAYTIRCGGKKSPIDDSHNWDGYWISNGTSTDVEYRLTTDDALKLQGFHTYQLVGKNTEKY